MARLEGSGIEVYAAESDPYAPRRLALAADLREALAAGEVDVYFQPKVSLADSMVVGAEALVRWTHPRLGPLSPDQFIPAAEHTGVIRALTLYVVEHGLRECRRWRDDGFDLSISVNLSARNLFDSHLVEDIGRAIAEVRADREAAHRRAWRRRADPVVRLVAAGWTGRRPVCDARGDEAVEEELIEVFEAGHHEEEYPAIARVCSVVRDRLGASAVAVVADTFWQAKVALDALPVEWDVGENGRVQQSTIDAMLDEGLNAAEAFVGNSNGDARAAIAAAPRKVEAVYSYPFQNHAPMEPMNATVVWTPQRCDVWCPTQNGEAALVATAQAAGLPQTQCDVHRMDLGGGFGRRTTHDWLIDAVLTAKQIPGVPIKTMWTREEDMVQGRYHPITKAKMTAGIDAQGNITGLHMRISGQSILSFVFPNALQNGRDPVQFQGLNASGAESAIGYSFPNLLIDHAMRNTHVPPHFWRGVNHNQNAIYLECFLDEVAHATGQDPLELRRKLMGNHPKHLAVLNAVAERIGWGSAPPAGRFRGIAQQMGFGSYVAAAAEVSVSDRGELRIHRIVAATDCGVAVNPRQIEMQVEGSFVYGLSALLYGECTVKDGAIEQTNFDTYNVLRMDEMPQVETIVMPSGGFWGGVGEPTIMVAAPAVLNAIFAATGKRIRSVPLKNQDLRRA